jgi:hypothetical protein
VLVHVLLVMQGCMAQGRASKLCRYLRDGGGEVRLLVQPLQLVRQQHILRAAPD